MPKTMSHVQKQPVWKKNTLETLSDFTSDAAKNTANSFKDLGTGVVNQLFGIRENRDNQRREQAQPQSTEKKSNRPLRKESNLFNYARHYEQDVVTQKIQELTELVAREIKLFEQSHSALMSDVKDVHSLTMNTRGEKLGIYHVRFLELVLNLMRTLRAKVGESRTWMQALISKKKKRGSLFAARSKNKGTQYSMSQELTITRAVQ